MRESLTMAGFTGLVHIQVLEAADLKPTAFTKRLPGISKSTLDCYVEISVDDQIVGKTAVRPKSLSPVWCEDFIDDVSVHIFIYII